MIYSKGQPLKKVATEHLVDELFAEIDRYYAAGKQVVTDAADVAAAEQWLAENEDDQAMTPERMAALEAEANEAAVGETRCCWLTSRRRRPPAGGLRVSRLRKAPPVAGRRTSFLCSQSNHKRTPAATRKQTCSETSVCAGYSRTGRTFVASRPRNISRRSCPLRASPFVV